jgi:Glycosyltransferase family 87
MGNAARLEEPRSVSERDGRKRNMRRMVAVSILLVLLILWGWLFVQEGAFKHGPNGKSFGGDAAMYVSAARVMKAGGNPYDSHLLYRSEQTWLAEQHVRQIAPRSVVRVGNPPLLFWALEPLTDKPLTASALACMALLGLSTLGGFLLLLGYLGWTARVVPSLVFLLMPQTVLGIYEANAIGLVFAGIAVAIVLADRNPWLAGAFLTAAWLKPPVGLPIALMVILFISGRRQKVATSFGVATALFALLTLLATGAESIRQWINGMAGYSNAITTSPAVSSLSGLYVRWAPGGARLVLEAATVLLAIGLTAFVWRTQAWKEGVPGLAVGWLWLAWFLAAPYAHFYDEILLTLPLMALLGPNGERLSERGPVLALYLTFFSLLLVSWAPGGVQLLCVPLLAIACVLYRRAPMALGT